MIKINLIAQRKVKRVDKGQQSLLLGFLSVLIIGALVFFFVHKPLAADIENMQRTNKKLKDQNKKDKDKLKGLKHMKAAVEALNKRKTAIDQLNKARAVPADMLHELSRLLTPNRSPTMTKEMAKRVENDPHRKLAPEWDPKHVWINTFAEKEGSFQLQGGAQSDGDVTQLAKRLEASAYFNRVVPEGGVEKEDKASGITYYDFTISGKVVY
jgi:Tfp pilus assembly protein PilN